MTEQELSILKEKAAKWDDLEEKIAECYVDEDGDELDEDDIDIFLIGKIAASAFD